ncbi:hypothetical protein ES705_14440 [subsurface metagenome]
MNNKTYPIVGTQGTCFDKNIPTSKETKKSELESLKIINSVDRDLKRLSKIYKRSHEKI